MTRAIETYHITAENIYNWDEKGFLIGHCGTTKRILTKQAYQQDRVRYAQQDGSREFISLLACACADGTALPPALIYQGASNDLQDSWLDDLNEETKAYFTSSAKGWTSDALGLAWLRRFHQDTQQKAGNRRRLLLVDGHSSHVNMAFLSLADSLRILVLILPPHSTHRLQPLDVGLFSPLAGAYTKELNAFTHRGLGWVSMTKRMFWPIFHTAWEKSFTAVNISKAFAKTGIWPLNAQMTLQRIRIPQQTTPSRLPQLPMATPVTLRGLRRLVRSSPSQTKKDLLERAVFRLAVRNEIISHENQGLRVAITEEKKRRQRGKRLNLVGEEEDGQAQFYSPQRILAAKAYQESKQQAEEENKLQKAQKKEAATTKRQQKEAEKQERAHRRQEEAVQRDLRRQLAQQEKQAKAAQKKAERAQKQQEQEQARLNKANSISLSKKRKNSAPEESHPKKRQKSSSVNTHHASTSTRPGPQTPHRVSQGPKNPPQLLDQAVLLPETGAAQANAQEVEICTRRGRAIKAPQRFLH